MGEATKPKTLLLALALLFAACSKQPDFARASVRELILWADREDADADREGVRLAAAALLERPVEAVWAECEVMRKDADPSVRHASVDRLGWLCSPFLRDQLSDARAVAIEAMLIDSLDDKDAGVRSAALFGYGLSCIARRPLAAADVVLVRIREQLVDPAESTRYSAAHTAFHLGPAARSCEPALVAALAVESADSVRLMLTSALGGIRAQQAASVQALIGRLVDPVEKVRFAAASSLGSIGAAAVSAIPALRVRFEASGEALDVRKATVRALLELVTTAAQAASVLTGLLQEQALYEDHEQGLWIAGIGRFTLLAPNSEPGQRAIGELTRISRGDDLSLAVPAIAALARIAAASPDGSLPAEWLAALRDGLALVQQDVADGRWAETDDDQFLLEAFVDLVRVPRFGVLRGEIEPLLKRLADDRERWWICEWAQRQLARLP